MRSRLSLRPLALLILLAGCQKTAPPPARTASIPPGWTWASTGIGGIKIGVPQGWSAIDLGNPNRERLLALAIHTHPQLLPHLRQLNTIVTAGHFKMYMVDSIAATDPKSYVSTLTVIRNDGKTPVDLDAVVDPLVETLRKHSKGAKFERFNVDLPCGQAEEVRIHTSHQVVALTFDTVDDEFVVIHGLQVYIFVFGMAESAGEAGFAKAKQIMQSVQFN